MGIRTGKEYLESLRDGRRISIEGELVKDVTRDRRFAGAAHTIAELLDMQHDAKTQDVLTFKSPTSGDLVGKSFMEPRTVEDLRSRRAALKCWADATYGMMGRSPDFMNVMLTACASAADYFEEGRPGAGKAIRAYYEHCRENDLAMTHVLVNPQVDRSRPVEKQEKDLAAKIVKETDAGIYISGARVVSTLAAFSNEVLVFPSSYISPAPEAANYAFGCGIPVNTEGVTWISRPTVLPESKVSLVDNPLANRFDESDAVVVFDNAFVPWERVFLYRDPKACNAMYPRTSAGQHSGTQSAVRALAKAEFMLGLACTMAKSAKTDEYLHVQGMIAEMIVFVETIKAVLNNSEHNAKMSPWGTMVPDSTTLWVVRMGFPKMFVRMQEIIQLLGASSLVGVPSYAELQGEQKELVNKYFQSANSDAEHRIKLFRLAFDASMSSFAGRQQLYERYYTGDPVRLGGTLFNAYDKQPYMDRLDAILNNIVERDEAWNGGLFDSKAA